MGKLARIIFFFIIIFNMISCNPNEKDNRSGTSKENSAQNKETQKKERDIRKVKINLEIGDTTVSAVMENNETTHDFLKLLPLTITMKELYGSEKYAELPVKLSKAGVRRQGYEIGDIGYWSPGNCFVIYYRQTGEIINGLQIMGKINDNIEAFERYKGTVTIKISTAE